MQMTEYVHVHLFQFLWNRIVFIFYFFVAAMWGSLIKIFSRHTSQKHYFYNFNFPFVYPFYSYHHHYFVQQRNWFISMNNTSFDIFMVINFCTFWLLLFAECKQKNFGIPSNLCIPLEFFLSIHQVQKRLKIKALLWSYLLLLLLFYILPSDFTLIWDF